MTLSGAARSHVTLRVDGEMSAADRATLTRVLLDRGLEVSSRKGEGITGEHSIQPEALASTIESQVNARLLPLPGNHGSRSSTTHAARTACNV